MIKFYSAKIFSKKFSIAKNPQWIISYFLNLIERGNVFIKYSLQV